MNNRSIEIVELNKSYGTIQAIKNINLTIQTGELFGLVGPDGAGKTTLIRILTTLLLADSGKASVNKLDVVKNYKQLREQIGYMPGRFSLYMDLSVEENLAFFATIFGTSIQENYDLIKPIYSQIEAFKTRKAGALSGGMKQKLALSCALIHRPKVLFLDEPTTGVDAVSRVEFWEMLKELKNTGITILVSTPYMDEAELCDRVALMQNGEILSIESPEELKNNFPHDLWYIKAENQYKLLQILRTWEKTYSAHGFGQSIHFVSQDSQMKEDEIRQFLESKTCKIQRIMRIGASIEDCFMELMNQPKKA
jgi:ABC-type multidrug transport system ATPase subunit